LSATISLTSAKPYGVERVCTIWEQPRSSFYAWRRNNAPAIAAPAPPEHNLGPKTKRTDSELLSKIQADLERSPFAGEGHRKVWARLRVVDEVRVSRKRILRLMRENRLLSRNSPWLKSLF
jgi:putative transposase